MLSSQQTRHRAVPDLFIDPAGIRALQMWNKALSCQQCTLYRLQNTILLDWWAAAALLSLSNLCLWKILYNCTFSEGYNKSCSICLYWHEWQKSTCRLWALAGQQREKVCFLSIGIWQWQIIKQPAFNGGRFTLSRKQMSCLTKECYCVAWICSNKLRKDIVFLSSV